jgi:hypothetical protein
LPTLWLKSAPGRTARRGNRDRGPDPCEVFSGRHLILRRLRPRNPVRSSQPMRNSRGGLGGIRSPGIPGAPPAFARSRQAKAPGEVFGLKSRPFRRRVIVASRTLTSNDFTPKCGGRQDYRRGLPGPLRPGPADHVQGGLLPVRGGNGGHVEMAETLISTRLLEVISNRSAGNGRSPGQPRFPEFPRPFPRTCRDGTVRVDIAGGSSGLRPGSNERRKFRVMRIFRA